ncbi:glycine--tRNA ligase subunit beta [Peptoniphilus sp. EMRHCC_23]|uniref:glycine--tRNA ligase subunit beta n=1 Tax=Peptoniphilus rachelemmaiella TaxID=2811779 RepID=UPI001C0012B5|nr:glycine--tRNA ligase subunit beta [Peptoniphilus rachelemmaiella]
MSNQENIYLIEVGVEELPSSYIRNALNAFKDLVEKALNEANLGYDHIAAYATPRRLSLMIHGIDDAQGDIEDWVKGPAKKIAYKEDGSVNKPLEGFMRSQNVTEADLEVRELKGNEYIYAHIHKVGEAAEVILAEIIPDAIRHIPFPKNMRWGGKNLRFARPIRWILSMLNDHVVDFDLEGIALSNVTRGHRFLGSSHIEINDVRDYEEALEKNFVILDQDKRKESILYQINHMAKSNGGEIRKDDDLLEELTFIVEYPTAVLGNVQEKFLSLPDVVITTPMREHLRYTPVYSPEGDLLPYFITIRNGNEDYADVVAEGNEKVLEARLEDARFFFDNDREKPLEDYVDQLGGIVFQEKLGTMADKTARISDLVGRIGEILAVGEKTVESAKRACHLSKADLMTNMVQEFTELEGIIGSIYAELDGEESVVSNAIREQYMPVASGAALPESTTGTIVSLADKFDTICGLFAIGEVPTGSQDPFALRRKAIGILRMINEKHWELSLSECIDASLFSFVDSMGLVFDKEEVRKQILKFFRGRIDTMLDGDGIRYDIIQALNDIDGEDSLRVFEKAQAMQNFFVDGDRKSFLEAVTRVENIASKNESKDGKIDEAILTEEERALYDKVLAVEPALEEAYSKRDDARYLELLDSLTDAIHLYFDRVMIMAEDESLRNNRLATIQRIDALVQREFNGNQIVEG